MIIQCSWMRDRQPHVQQTPRICTRQISLPAAGVLVLVAISLGCTLQAILHFQNLPTFVMLITMAIFAESLILRLTGFTPQSCVDSIRLCFLALSCSVILLAEYRLQVPNLISSVTATLLAGTARALRRIVIKSYPEKMPPSTEENVWLFAASCIVGAIWGLVFWLSDEVIVYDFESMPLLFINAVSTAVALLMGKSIILAMDYGSNYQQPLLSCTSARGVQDAMSLVALVGAAGCFSNLLLRRSYTSWIQLGGFLLAIGGIGSTAIDGGCCRWAYRRWGITHAYAVAPRSQSESESEQGDGATWLEVTDATQKEPIQTKGQSLVRVSLTTFATASMWIAYLFLNATNRDYPRFDAALDSSYRPPIPTEIVVSMYKEPLDQVTMLASNLKRLPGLSKAQLTIYIKEITDNERIKQETGADAVITRPNIGREAETYLHHILTRWDRLAKHTIFLQADVHNPREFYPRLGQYFSPAQTGFLSLGWAGSVCNCEDCGDKLSWRDDTGLFPSLHRQIHNSTVCGSVLLSYKGQFVVSAARIRGLEKKVYRDLWQDLADRSSWAHQETYLQGRPDSMSAPWFGYTMERAWNLLFQCNNMDVAWKCPSLLSGRRLSGDIGDCQCFD